MKKIKAAIRSLFAWYRTPLGLAYLALTIGAGVLAVLGLTGWAIAVLLPMVALLVPYKIYREGGIRQEQIADAAAEVRKDATDALQAANADWDQRFGSEHIKWSETLEAALAQTLEERDELRSQLEVATQDFVERLGEIQQSVSDLTASVEARGQEIEALEPRLEELADTVVEAVPRFTSIVERLDGMSARIQTERGRRSLGFARRDAEGVEVTGAIAMITPQRSGSTWLFDMLRCHPNVMVFPTAELFHSLGGAGRRYPADLSDTNDATLDIEVAKGVGAAIPEYRLSREFQHDPGRSIAIEKLHPMILGFDAASFVDRLGKVDEQLADGAQALYLVREPADSLRSFMSYQQRSQAWHSNVPSEAVLDMYLRSYEMIADLAVKLPGTVVTYDQLAQPVGLVARLYQIISPGLDQQSAVEMAVGAVDATRRDKRQQVGPFITGQSEKAPSDLELTLGTFARDPDQARSAFDRCRDLYRNLAEMAERQLD